MARFTLIFIALFLFGASLFSVFGYSFFPYGTGRIAHHVTRFTPCKGVVVYDGDTFGCDLNGNGRVDNQAEHIRLLGIDATEMHYSPKNHTGKDEPFAVEAKQFVEARTLNKVVYLELDQRHYDKYARTLAYVYLDPDGTTMLNELLLEKGLARTLFIGENRRYESEFLRLEHLAQQNRLNLWGTAQQASNN